MEDDGMAVQSVFVIGAGTMGHGIAQLCAAGGLQVRLNDIEKSLIEKGIGKIASGLEKLVQKQKIASSEKDAILGRISPALSLSEASGSDLVIEAAVENLGLKVKIFQEIEKAVRPEVILATNTSSLSVTKIASGTSRPDKVIGMHFFNPVPIMKLIEIVRALQTSDETFMAIRDMSLKLGKTPVEVKDYPGFVSNRVLMVMINEAVFSLYEDVGSAQDIDTVMKLGMNHPMGPLELADLIGLDTCLFILERLYTGFNDPKFRPCPLLANMVAAGRLGRKTGRGFYSYEK
jgi:3-hydroxybutyryl-CoA dehydrogenase